MLEFIFLLLFLRFICPFEILPLTTNIYFPHLISKGIAFLLRPEITLKFINLSVWNGMILLWIGVFLYRLYRFIRVNQCLYTMIRFYGEDMTRTEPCSGILKNIYEEKAFQKKVKIIKASFVKEPMVCRFGVYYILLPETLQLNESEWHYVLMHETEHIFHHDLAIKIFVQLICMLYWWNPFMNLFRKQVDQLLELQVDKRVTHKNKKEKVEYLTCLIRIAKQITEAFQPKEWAGLAFTTQSGKFLEQRFRVLTEKDSVKSDLRVSLLLAPICICYVLSFLYILEPYYVSPEVKKESFALTADNTYFVQTAEDTYDIYYNGEFLAVTDSPESYPKGCKIYLLNGKVIEYEN